MVKRNDRQPSSENYPFIKETIKERPIDKKNLLHKILTAAICGVIFGSSAAGTAALILPGIVQSIGGTSKQREDVTLISNETESSKENIIQNQNDTDTKKAQKKTDTAQDETYTDTWAEQVRKAAETPRKALVRIAALGKDSDLLDDSFLKYGEDEGFVFLKNSEAFYIMTCSADMSDAGDFQVTFSNGDTANAQLCKKDSRTDFYVFCVPFTEVRESTQKDIPEAEIVSADEVEQMSSVIAIGSPTGDYDSLVSGRVTSIDGNMKIADEEYSIFTTDMVGSADGGGLLLNMSGKVVGIICSQENEGNSVIRAVEAAQLRPLLEDMANSEEICYIGIQGVTISEIQSENLDIPRGVYVDSVEEYSPAMSAGVQNADIIHTLNGEEICTMSEYSDILQKLTKGSKVKLEVYRKNPYDTYVNVELTVTIKEK